MPIDTTHPTRQLQVGRSEIKIGRRTLDLKIIDWLVNVAELLGRAWHVWTGDQDAIAKRMPNMWIKSTIVVRQAELSSCH